MGGTLDGRRGDTGEVVVRIYLAISAQLRWRHCWVTRAKPRTSWVGRRSTLEELVAEMVKREQKRR